jgi:AraC-like DNA-binding protein
LQAQAVPHLQSDPHLQAGAQLQLGAQVYGLHWQVLVISNLHPWVAGAVDLDWAAPRELNAAAARRFFLGRRFQVMPAVGQGRIVVGRASSLWVLEAVDEEGETDFHAHHAIQLTFSLEGEFTLRTADSALAGPAAAVAKDARHIFRATGIGAFLFVEPESPAGRAIGETLLAGRAIAPIDPDGIAPQMAGLLACFRDPAAGDDDFLRLADAIVSALAGSQPAALPDPRVERMIAFAEQRLDGPVTLEAAARAVDLSEGRARHLFAAQTGLPFKTFLLWLRIKRAVELYAGGAALTEAAHEAGFADSAHFSRTFRRHFGLPAAALRVNSRYAVGASDRPGAQ